MLVKIDEKITINLDQVVAIFENNKVDFNTDLNIEGEDASLVFLFSDLTGLKSPIIVYFADEHLQDLALSDIQSSYQEGCKYCDITKYVKKGE